MEKLSVKENRRKSNYKETLRKYGLAIAFVSPYFLAFLFFSVIPLLSGFFISLFKYDPYNGGFQAFVGLDNYLKIFQDNVLSRTFWNCFLKTLCFDVVAVPLLIIIPLGLAYLINLKPPGYKIFRAIIYLPSVVSITIVGIIFGAIFSGQKEGLINALFGSNIDWLGVPTLRWTVMLIASIWWQTGTNFVILGGALRNVPKSLYEACEMDGGNKFKTFLYVTLPNIKGTIGICVFTTLVSYLGLYGQPKVLNSGVNKNDYESPMMLIQGWLSDVGKSNLTGLICATAVFFGILVMLISLLQKSLMKEKKRGTRYAKEFEAFSLK